MQKMYSVLFNEEEFDSLVDKYEELKFLLGDNKITHIGRFDEGIVPTDLYVVSHDNLCYIVVNPILSLWDKQVVSPYDHDPTGNLWRSPHTSVGLWKYWNKIEDIVKDFSKIYNGPEKLCDMVVVEYEDLDKIDSILEKLRQGANPRKICRGTMFEYVFGNGVVSKLTQVEILP